MIELETRHLAGIEILHATPAGQRDQPLPTVVFYHGFSSSKLVYSYFAVALAQAGIRVVMPDARDHGARFNGDATARLGQFWQILHSNLLEFDALQKALYAEGLIIDGRLAVGGINGRHDRAGYHDAVLAGEMRRQSDGFRLLHNACPHAVSA